MINVKKSPKSPFKKSSPKRVADLAEIAFQRLQKAILSGELKEGERVREKGLAREWGIGRTPLREAVRRAAEFGYLILKPNYAPVVRQLSKRDIQQIYALREVLECFALRTNWQNFRPADFKKLRVLEAKVERSSTVKSRLRAQFDFDNELHQLWVRRCDNPWLVSSLKRILICRPSFLTFNCDLADEAYEYHRQILNALERGDQGKAGDFLARHIRKSAKDISRPSVLFPPER